MCGIAGKLYLDPGHVVKKPQVKAMIDVLAHRGPDGSGIWCDRNVGLGHRRLSIIDLRAIANQPMGNEDGSLWITYNGEVYNFRDLRGELESLGHVFRTQSDTEVILHAYEQYGEGCLDRLRGMFAFAIWDRRSDTLFLARDRVGKKPLFYYHGPNCFLFASEAKAILQDPAVPIEPNLEAIHHFLTLQYIPAPLTAFRGIKKLPPAHWLRVRNGQVKLIRYWKLRYTPKRSGRAKDLIAELLWQIAEAVRIRLVSDVPLGAFLSGGIDSSAVVAYMAQQTDRPVRTFSVGFDQAEFDERRFAKMVAKQFGTDHTELVVNPSAVDLLPRLVWHYDEPFGDSSAIPSYCISELTRQHVTVVLNGDGGDESFAGYPRYVVNRRAYRGELVPLPLRRLCAAAIRRLPDAWGCRQPLRKLHAVAEAMALSPERRYAMWIAHLNPEARSNLYSPDFRAAMADVDVEGLFVRAFQESDAEDWTDATLDTDVNLYLPEDLLVKMDRASMAHSLEARSPLLDHVLMEFAASLPADMKLWGSQKKLILRQALRGLIPDAILDRPKMGFTAPIRVWFRGELREMAQDLLLSTQAMARGYFRRRSVERLLGDHATGKADLAEQLWDLLVLEIWHRKFIDGEDVPGTGEDCYTPVESQRCVRP